MAVGALAGAVGVLPEHVHTERGRLVSILRRVSWHGVEERRKCADDDGVARVGAAAHVATYDLGSESAD